MAGRPEHAARRPLVRGPDQQITLTIEAEQQRPASTVRKGNGELKRGPSWAGRELKDSEQAPSSTRPGMETAQLELREWNADQKNARYSAGEIRAEAREIGAHARKLEAERHGLELGRLVKGASWKRRPARNSRAGSKPAMARTEEWTRWLPGCSMPARRARAASKRE